MTTSLDINNVNDPDPDPDSETKVEFPPLSFGDSLLAKYLERNAVDRVVVVGLATDYVSAAGLNRVCGKKAKEIEFTQRGKEPPLRNV